MEVLGSLFGEINSTLIGVLIFLATGTLAFSIMAIVRVQGAVRRRAANIGHLDPLSRSSGSRSSRSLRQQSLAAAQRVVDYTTKYYSSDNNEETKLLRQRMIRAGIYHNQAIAYFFISRVTMALGLAGLAFLFSPVERGSTLYWLSIMVAGIAGYVMPSLYLDRRIKSRLYEHQAGFPDFMDLLVVCADAGLSMEASLERIGRELSDSYPSLTANIHMANLEIRAGRSMTDALEHFADRLGLEEARSFATLVQQSAELGSSITDALRVYSDDMRHKRLSRAEEKAYALPAKLSVPMMLCIFPVLFVVILLPVIVRLTVGVH